MSNAHQIYVYLLDEGTDSWRPVDAEHMEGLVYRIISNAPDPELENWEFTTGDVVVCERRTLSGGECLVAVSKR